MERRPMTLDDVLAPVTWHDFRDQYLGQRYLRQTGTPRRFQSLTDWELLNQALNTMRVSGDRLLLVSDSVAVRPEIYLHNPEDRKGTYIRTNGLISALKQGATLVLNKVDEIFPGIRNLSESCEDVFRVHVGVNLYASWRKTNGFELHWDQHDTIVMQIAGRKRWQVYEPTVLHPLPGESSAKAAKPTRPPAWEGTLEDGDMLYMPRGWWHVAFAIDEPSLHLTAGFAHPTGADVLSWLGKEMRQYLETRMDVPHWQDAEAQRIWSTGLREKLIALMTDDMVPRYMRWVDDAAHARPLVRLPDAVSDEPMPLTSGTRLRLSQGSRLHIESADDPTRVRFRANGADWQCDAGLTTALHLLSHIRPSTLAQLQASIEPRHAVTLRVFLATLLTKRVVWAESEATVEKAVAASRGRADAATVDVRT
jgi:ribosomal protein L16 Arg81 hydroxylase